ncbi:hypothetical protein ZEAMMB73_Zm00001d021398 [Zea mays]|uniref:Uncharacterized protein n=1 Tax=Zea mays TaxID=4577 RepID=A0A1D6IAN6_MAIZE|nr:hypothetical protein ZEAMMB73_Zm00001d021398 [Zea mays]
MGLCYGKSAVVQEPAVAEENNKVDGAAVGRGDGPPASPAKVSRTPKQLKLSLYLPSPLPPSSYKGSLANSSVASTPARGGFKRPFLPPSPAKHIRALLARSHGSVKSISEGGEPDLGLDKSFGYSRHFAAKYDLGREVGRDHFGFTYAAKCKKGELKGKDVAVKVIPKAKAALEEILYQFEEKLQAEREKVARKQEKLQAQLQAQHAALEENQSLLRETQEEVKGIHTKFEETNALLRAVLKLQKD